MTCLEAIRAGLVIVRDSLSSMEEDVLSREYGADWWDQAVLRPLEEDGKLPYGWPEQGNAGDLDLQTALKLAGVYHWELFSDTFDWGGRERGLLQAMTAIRNQYEGHVTPNREKELTPAVTDEILEGMARFLRLFDRSAAKKIEAIEVPRNSETEEVSGISFAEEIPPVRPKPAVRPTPRIERENREEEPSEDRPLTEEERERIEASGYKSLWDQEDEQPSAPYSGRQMPKPAPKPKARPVLYQGVRVEEQPRQQTGKAGQAVNLQNLRRTEAPRSAKKEESAVLHGMPRVEERPEEVADPEPFPVQGKGRNGNGRVAGGSGRTAKPVQFSGRPWWEEKQELAPEPVRREVIQQVRPKKTASAKKENLLTVKQKWILGLWIARGIALGVGFILLDIYMKHRQSG